MTRMLSIIKDSSTGLLGSGFSWFAFAFSTHEHFESTLRIVSLFAAIGVSVVTGLVMLKKLQSKKTED